MAVKNLTLYFFQAIIFIAAVSCERYAPLEFPADTELHRRDSITLVLNSTMNADSIEKTVVWLQEMGTRFALAPNSREVALKIRNKFIKMGYIDSRLDSFMVAKRWNNKDYSVRNYNVITELRGTLSNDSVMIIGSHYDAIVSSGDPFTSTPGANDNASGVAALTEIARVMKSRNYSPLITIQFVAFGAEEIGLLGSGYYAAKLRSAGIPVKMMINNDMIANVISSNNKTWEINILRYGNSVDLYSKARYYCGKYTGLISTNDTSNYKRSDSYPFFLNSIKAIYFSSNGIDNNYHTANDIAANCNFDFCTLAAKISCAMLVYYDGRKQ